MGTLCREHSRVADTLGVTLVPGTVRILGTEVPQGVPVRSPAMTFGWNYLPAEGHPGSSGDPQRSLGGVPWGRLLLGRDCGLSVFRETGRGTVGS